MSMTNFRGEDMPGSQAWADAQTDLPVLEDKKKKAEPAKKPAAKKAPAKKPAAKKEPEAPEQTDTETHGVGPSTVEGENAEDEKKEEN